MVKGLRRERGQSLVELAILLPALLILFVMLVEVGAAAHSYFLVTNAAREGARMAVKGEYSDDDIALLVLQSLRSLPDATTTDEEGRLIANPETTTVILSDLAQEWGEDRSFSYRIVEQRVIAGAERPSNLSEAFLNEKAQEAGAYSAWYDPESGGTRLIAVEVFYAHPQMLGFFNFSVLPQRVTLWSHTIMRVGATSRENRCSAYPIAVHSSTIAGAQGGEYLGDIFNGAGPGNFGWLRWPSHPSGGSANYLVDALQNPSLSLTDYENPADPDDHSLTTGDWVWGNTGLSNSNSVRQALDSLVGRSIRVLVWDQASGTGNNLRYHVAGFAVIRIVDYQLAPENRITAQFVRMETTCR